MHHEARRARRDIDVAGSVLHGGVDPARCDRCLFVQALCVCADVAAVGPLATRTRVVILRHHTERYRSSNTGRLAHLALVGSELHDVFGPDRHRDGPALPAGTYLVFPEGPIRTEAPAPPPTALVFLDATWHQARRMRQRLPYLRGLPPLALAPIPAAARMRAAPKDGLVSTIEAIAAALRLVEGDAAADRLDQLFAVACARSRASGRGSVARAG